MCLYSYVGTDRDPETSSVSGSRLDLSSGPSNKKKGSSRSKESRSLTTGDIDKMKVKKQLAHLWRAYARPLSTNRWRFILCQNIA